MQKILRTRKLLRVYALQSSTPAGCGGFKRSAHSARPSLDAWMLGCFEDWREDWKDLNDWEDWEDREDREDWEDWEDLTRINGNH